MADSKADTKGIAVDLDKTFKKGLLEGVNVGFSGFFGKTKEEGAENYNAPETKVTEAGVGFTTKKMIKRGAGCTLPTMKKVLIENKY